MAPDVTSAELQLGDRLKTEALTTFGRQYLGVVVAGRRVLQIRGFCESYYKGATEPRWERVPILLLDAGGCAFQAEFDVEKGNITKLEWGTAGP
jgi:hypothetical protein